MTDGYVFLPDGASFQWARCSLCFKGQVITKVDDMVGVRDLKGRSSKSYGKVKENMRRQFFNRSFL